MSRDSVAVLHIDRLAAIRYREAIARKNAHHPDERTQCEERIAALDAAIATLTREAAPQASGGDGRYTRHSILRQHAAQSVAKSGSGAILVSAAAVSDLFADLDAALATPDSAIQSQQGATGGAEWPAAHPGDARGC